MPNHSVHKASDLAPEERMFVERWLGRALSRDETVTLNAYRPHAAPVSADREALRRSIIAQAREIGSRGPDVSEDEADALVDEAFAVVRGTTCCSREDLSLTCRTSAMGVARPSSPAI
jgi:hypothetical protein